MYNTHRGMVPPPNSRLTELLDQLRQEFETQTRSTGEFEHQRTCVSFLLLPVSMQFALDRCVMKLVGLPMEELYGFSQGRFISSFCDHSSCLERDKCSASCRGVGVLCRTLFADLSSFSDRTAPGDGDDSTEGLSTGTSANQDEARVCLLQWLPPVVIVSQG